MRGISAGRQAFRLISAYIIVTYLFGVAHFLVDGAEEVVALAIASAAIGFGDVEVLGVHESGLVVFEGRFISFGLEVLEGP